MLAGCGNGDKSGSPVNTDAQNGGGEAAAGTKTIKIFQYKVEIAEALNRLKAEYESSHPGIKLDIQTVGAEVTMVQRSKPSLRQANSRTFST